MGATRQGVCKIPCTTAANRGTPRMIPTTRDSGLPVTPVLVMETARRENYDSGEHFVLEYGELSFTFNEPASGLGEHVNDCWPELVGPAERSLVHWLRRLVFRGAWLDQRVKEGELSVSYDEQSGTFAYVQPTDPASPGSGEPIEL